MAFQPTTAAPYLQLFSDRIVKTATPGVSQQLSEIISLSATQGTFGAIGSMDIEIPITDGLNAVGILQGQIPVAARRGDVSAKAFYGTGGQPFFFGVLDTITMMLEHDSYKMHFRDVGAVMMERTVRPQLAQPNESIHDFVERLISDAGLTAFYVAPTVQSNGMPIKIGTVFQDKHYFNLVKETTWGVLQRLAKVTGNVVYLDGSGQVYFGPRNIYGVISIQTAQLKFSRSTPDSDLKSLEITHQPYRHSAFIMNVFSHVRDSGQNIIESCYYLNSDLGQDADGSPAGLYLGFTTQDALTEVGDMPVYNQYIEGKLRDLVYAQILSQSREIQAQEIVLKGTVIPGTDPTKDALQIGQPLRVSGTGFPMVDNQDFVITGLHYSYDMESGFLLHFTAWEDDAPLQGREGPE